MKGVLRAVPTMMLVLVGATSFLLSYVAIRDVSVRLEAVPEYLAWAVPVTVDGGILAGSAAIWSSSYRRKKRDPLAFLTVATLLATSVVVNVSHAGPSPLAKWIAALPPLILLATLEIVASQHRGSLTEDAPETATEPVTEDAAAPAGMPVAANPVPPAHPTPPQTPYLRPVPAVATVAEVPARVEGYPAAPRQDITEPVIASTPTPAAPASAPATPVVPPTSVAPAPVAAPVVASGAADRPATPTPAPIAPPAVAPVAVPVPVAGDTVDQAAREAARDTAREAAAVASSAARSTGSRRQLRVQAAAPDETPNSQQVLDLFTRHVETGGDAADRALAGRIAEQTGLSVQYVRRILKPARDEALATS